MNVLQHFQDIVKTEDDVKKLKDFILQKAMRGELVEQDPNDEPASVLLEKIEEEKERLVKEKKIRKPKKLPEITDYEKPYELPEGWEWVRLGQLISVSSGTNLTKKEMDHGGNIPVYGGNGINGYHSNYNCNYSTLAIGRVGYYCGSVHILPQKSWVTDNAFIVSFSKDNIDIHWLYNILKTVNLKINASATAQPVISGRKIYPILIPFPPIEEQKRIVIQIDKLFSICDQLEEQIQKKNTSNSSLNKGVFNRIQDANNPSQYEDLNFAVEHMDSLCETEDDVQLLKQSLLNLTVQGKLVKQDPNDEPASVLLKQIEEEKEQLVKEKKIRKPKKLPDIKEDEKPYELPEGWEWVRLNAVAHFINGDRGKNYPSKDKLVSSGIPFINAGSLYKGSIDKSRLSFITEERFELLGSGKVNNGDLLYCLRGTLGKTSIVNDLEKGAIASSLVIIRPYVGLYSSYLYYYLISNLGKNMISFHDNGSAQPNLSANDVKKYKFPLPPVSEQKRIVNQIDKLFSICDQLIEQIQSRNAIHANFDIAAFHEVSAKDNA
ncbi:restriction endonuclease subunit S [Barrientosiimonas marina]|uniref:Restriction endonuclease subunit S n=1 Tax=Lentibacillus kimchii TaxID=1542911 RepID=A0ABW2UYI4_9BACI